MKLQNNLIKEEKKNNVSMPVSINLKQRCHHQYSLYNKEFALNAF